MTTAEAAGLLALSGLDLAPGEVEALVSKTEGWPAGLYLAALALSDEPDVSAAVAEFGGDDGIVAEYLCDEVLSTLSSDLVSFLMRTSVLDRLSGSVCDAVIGRRGTASLLSTLARKELLLVPLDRKDESYRCHRMLREMLQAELRRRKPDLQARAHSRAGDWYAVNGDVDRAAHHAVTAGDPARAADLIGVRGAEYVSERRNAMLQRWLSSFTAEEVAAHAALALAAAGSHLMCGELDAVRHLESATQRIPERDADCETIEGAGVDCRNPAGHGGQGRRRSHGGGRRACPRARAGGQPAGARAAACSRAWPTI